MNEGIQVFHPKTRPLHLQVAAMKQVDELDVFCGYYDKGLKNFDLDKPLVSEN